MDKWFRRRQSRRRMLQKLGILAGAGLSLEAGVFTVDKAMASMVSDDPAHPIQHVLVACQENRTFDEYFASRQIWHSASLFPT